MHVCCVKLVLKQVVGLIFALQTSNLSILGSLQAKMKAAKGKGAAKRETKEALKPVDDRLANLGWCSFLFVTS